MPKIYIISHKYNIIHCDLIEVDDKLYEFFNKFNCFMQEEFEKRLLQYVTEVYKGEVRTDENERSPCKIKKCR